MVYMNMCENCSRKIGRLRIVTDASEPFFGRCPQCFLPGKLMRYNIGPTYDEAERRRRKAQQDAKGGGERARAGRRAR